MKIRVVCEGVYVKIFVCEDQCEGVKVTRQEIMHGDNVRPSEWQFIGLHQLK